jgi:hypothetical protein
LTLQRSASGTSGAIPAGYGFVDERGIKLSSTDVVPVSAGATTVVVHVRTQRQTELVNTEDDADVEIDPNSPIVLNDAATSVLVAPAGSVGIVATTLTEVASATQILGASCDYLSLHGKERGQLRQSNEPEEAYRLRVRNIPDVVTPIAVALAVRGAGAQATLGDITVREPFEDLATPALKARYGLDSIQTYFLSGSSVPALSPLTDFYDDPVFAPSPPPTGFIPKPRELFSIREGRAYFRVETPGELRDPDGLRFFADYSFLDDPVFGYLDVVEHPVVVAALMAIWEEANRKRAAAVQFDVLLPLSKDFTAVGDSAVAGTTLVATLTAAAGKSWLMVDAVAGHDAALSGVAPDPTADSHHLIFTFIDASTFTTADFAGISSEHLTNSALSAQGFPFDKRVAQIDGYVTGSGARDLNLVVEARVLEFTE